MKKKFNQISGMNVVTAAAALVSLLLFINASFSASLPATEMVSSPTTIVLSPNVSSNEIQTALDRLPDGGGEVVLPAGEIIISQPIILSRSNQTLRGAGDTTVLRLAANANCPVIIMGEPVNHPRRMVKHLLVTDLLIDGTRQEQSRELWKLSGEGSEIRNNGITVQHVSDSLVENVTCARCRSGGLVTTRDVRHLTVRNFAAFDNQFDGLACYQTEHSLFADLYLHDNPGAGISLDLAFNHNVISNAVLVANDLGVFMRASRDNQFYDVTIHNSHHFGVFMAHTELFAAGRVEPAPETACTDNAFTNLTATNCGGAAFRVNNITCTNNVVIAPKFAENKRGGLSLAQPNLVTVQ